MTQMEGISETVMKCAVRMTDGFRLVGEFAIKQLISLLVKVLLIFYFILFIFTFKYYQKLVKKIYFSLYARCHHLQQWQMFAVSRYQRSSLSSTNQN